MAADWDGPSSLDPQADRANQVLLVITVTLVALAAVNAIVITWATALDARHSSALARALGATPGEVSAGLSAAQVLPAFAGAILGVPGGLALLPRSATTRRTRRSGSCSPWCRAPRSWWRRSPPSHPPRRPPPGDRNPSIRTRLTHGPIGRPGAGPELFGCGDDVGGR